MWGMTWVRGRWMAGDLLVSTMLVLEADDLCRRYLVGFSGVAVSGLEGSSGGMGSAIGI